MVEEERGHLAADLAVRIVGNGRGGCENCCACFISSEGSSSQERKVSGGMKLCVGLVQLAAAIKKEDLRGAVV